MELIPQCGDEILLTGYVQVEIKTDALTWIPALQQKIGVAVKGPFHFYDYMILW